jgi:hypothetical protein
MSISIVLVPLAIALSLTTSEKMSDRIKHNNGKQLPPIETIFNDVSMLEKTLREHGLSVNVLSDNLLVCNVNGVQLNYIREDNVEPFFVTINGVRNTHQFLNEIECFENEYRQNVQSYTYNKLVENLSQNNMKITEEDVLEDNSIVLTVDTY